MRIYLVALLCILYCQDGFAQAVSLEEALASEELFEFRELSQGYRGRYDKVHDEAGIESGRSLKISEYTHVRRTNHGNKITTPVVELVVCGENEDDCRAPTVLLRSVPPFDTLKKLKTIAEFERAFGKFWGFTDAWGDENVVHSSMGWLVFVPRDSGELRVVEVFLSTINRGDGWKIDKRQIREGLFRPTGRPPIREKSEEQ